MRGNCVIIFFNEKENNFLIITRNYYLLIMKTTTFQFIMSVTNSKFTINDVMYTT